MKIKWMQITLCAVVVSCIGCAIQSSSPHPPVISEAPWAGPLPAFDVSSIVKQSDAVVVGKLKSTDKQENVRRKVEGNEVVGQYRISIIEVEAVYKGEVKSSRELSVRYFWPQENLGDVASANTKLYFLSSGQKEEFILTDSYHPSFPVLERRPEIDKNFTAYEAVESELLQNIEFGSEKIVMMSLDVLRNNSKALDLATIRLSKSDSLEIRATAAAYRASGQDMGAFDEAVKVVEEAKAQKSDKSDYIIGIASTAFMHLADKLSAQQMKRLLTFQEPNIDFAVGSVVNEVAVGDKGRRRSKTEFAPIAVELLHSSNKDVQYNAIQLLSVLRGDGPSKDEFLTDPQKYIVDFSKWWEKEGKVKAGAEK